MNKELEIVHRLTAITKIAKINMTLGLSEEIESLCMFVLKDRKFYNKLSEQLLILQNVQEEKSFEAFLPEQKVVALVGRLGQLMNTTILLAVNENLDVDCLVLFKDVELIDKIFREWKKIQEGFKWKTL